MRVFLDGQALQSGHTEVDAQPLLHALLEARPDCDWTLVEVDSLPKVAGVLPDRVHRCTFNLPLPQRPRNLDINESYFGDWLTAQRADAFVALDLLDPKTTVPRFRKQPPIILGVVRDLSSLLEAAGSLNGEEHRLRWCASRIQALLAADTLLVTSEATELLLRDLVPNLASRVVVAGDITIGLCQCLGPRLTPTARKRKRIAWVSPLPPTPSGIADYSADMLLVLARLFDIDLVIDPGQPDVDGTLSSRFWTLTPAEVSQRHAARPYDLFVYQLGNSGYHVYMLELMRRFRGLAVLHDYFMGGFVASCRERGKWPAALCDELTFEGESHLADWHRLGHINDFVVRQMTPLNRRILELADAVVVHSAWSWQRVRRIVDVPVARVPMPMPISPQRQQKETLRRQFGIPASSFVICSLGHNGHVKRLPSLLRGVAGLPPEIRGACQVVLVGPMDADSRAQLVLLADSLGLGGQVRSTGWVSADEFTGFILAADVCVQLRYPTFGETSASVLRALAAGTPCVTSDQGPMAELPDEIVLKVRSPHHEVEDLTTVLGDLIANPDRLAVLGQRSRHYVDEHHHPTLSVETYAAVIEQTVARRREQDANWQEATAQLLESMPLSDEEHDRLIAEWAALRECTRKQSDQSMLPERTAA